MSLARSITAAIYGIALCSCAAQDAASDDSSPATASTHADLLAEVRADNGNVYRFVALQAESGLITDVGVLEIGANGTASLATLDANELNPLNLFRGLTNPDVAIPTTLAQLYQPDAQPRGWLAAKITSSLLDKALNNCSDTEWLSRFGDLQSGYDYHPGPDQGAWLNRNGTFAWQMNNIDKIHTGVCVQSASSFTHVLFKYRPGSEWIFVFDEYYVSAGHWYHWHGAGSNIDYRLEVDPVGTGVYDLGFDYDG